MNEPPTVDVEGPLGGVVVREVGYTKGSKRYPHKHRYGQIIHSIAGHTLVRTADHAWFVPRNRAVWIPPMCVHQVDILSDTHMKNLFLAKRYASELPDEPVVLNVLSAFRELTGYLAELQAPFDRALPDSIATLLVRMVSDSMAEPFAMPLPRDSALRALFTALIENPASQKTLEDWAAQLGLSSRSLSRRLLRDTGMTFRVWRQQLRLLVSLDMLAAGEPVTNTALDVGYKTASSFITAFRQNFGMPPTDFLQHQH